MKSIEIHDSVENFKQFVKKNPSLISVVRGGKRKWQDLFDDWYILGEEHESWAEYTTVQAEPVETVEAEPVLEKTEEKSDSVSQLMSYLKKVDINQVQSSIATLGSTLSTVQGLMGQFQQKPSVSRNRERPRPFGFRRD